MRSQVGQFLYLERAKTKRQIVVPIAAPMVGGLVTSFILELLGYPAVFAIWKGRRLPP